MNLDKNRKICIADTTLRDGNHAVSHSYIVEQVTAIASGLDKVGVDIIELSHGDDLADSSINYEFSATPEIELIRAASQVVRRARLGVLLLPGMRTIESLKEARTSGAQVVRVTTHVTEADAAIQHLKATRELGVMPVGSLMMAHMAPPRKMLEQVQIFVDTSAEYASIADSAGYMTPDDVRARVSLLMKKLPIPMGFHAHNSLGLAVASMLATVECGMDYIDMTCQGLGAGAGNAQAEVVAGVSQRLDYSTGPDFYSYMNLAENVVGPVMRRPQITKNTPLMLGYAGVYSSFLLHAYRAIEKFHLNPRDVSVELDRRDMAGGQEDMIIDVAHALSLAKTECRICRKDNGKVKLKKERPAYEAGNHHGTYRSRHLP